MTDAATGSTSLRSASLPSRRCIADVLACFDCTDVVSSFHRALSHRCWLLLLRLRESLRSALSLVSFASSSANWDFPRDKFGVAHCIQRTGTQHDGSPFAIACAFAFSLFIGRRRLLLSSPSAELTVFTNALCADFACEVRDADRTNIMHLSRRRPAQK